MRRWIGLMAAGVVLACPPAAAAADLCVDPSRPDDCFESAAEAFTSAAASEAPDVITLSAAVDEEGAFSDGGFELAIAGSYATLRAPDGATEPVLELSHPDSVARRLKLTGPVSLSATLADSFATGAVTVSEAARLEHVAVDGDVGAVCAAEQPPADAIGRHVTVTGGVTAGCGRLALSDSLVLGEIVESGGAVTTRYCAYAGPASHTPGSGDLVIADPVLAADGLRPASGSPLIDAGDPVPLTALEPLEDLDGRPRMADGDGDGSARRDIGGFEFHPPPPAAPAGNLLANPGAEQGVTGWQAAGVSSFPYGLDFFPTTAAGEALGAGARFFSGDAVTEGRLLQRVDLRPWAPEIDAGLADARLSLLLGGYRAEADAGSAQVTFAGPDGGPVGLPISVPAVTAAERGNAITLLRRSAAGPVPILARAATVTLTAVRSDGSYADAYFDDVALTLDAPSLPPPPPPPPPDRMLRPFSGVAVLTPVLRPSHSGRVRLRLGCHDATVGRCAGTLTLVAVLRSDTLARRIGSAGFAFLPGQMRSVRIRLTPAARRALHRRRGGRLRATLYAAARDGQGLTATRTSPMTIKQRRKRKRRR